MPRHPQPSDGRGSLCWIQPFVNDRPEELDAAIRAASDGRLATPVDWRSPRREDAFAEYRGGGFLDLLGIEEPPQMASKLVQFLAGLKRRRVYHVAAVYVVVGVGILGAAEVILDPLGLQTLHPYLVVLVLLGFPIATYIGVTRRRTWFGISVPARIGFPGRPSSSCRSTE